MFLYVAVVKAHIVLEAKCSCSKRAIKKKNLVYHCSDWLVTFGSQVGCEHVSIVAAEGTSLHTRRRHVPRVRIRLIGVWHETIINIQRICIDKHTNDTVGRCVDGLDGTQMTLLNDWILHITFSHLHFQQTRHLQLEASQSNHVSTDRVNSLSEDLSQNQF